MKASLPSLLRGETGATSIEYALIASLVAVVIVVAVTALGTDLSALYNSVAAAFP